MTIDFFPHRSELLARQDLNNWINRTSFIERLAQIRLRSGTDTPTLYANTKIASLQFRTTFFVQFDCSDRKRNSNVKNLKDLLFKDHSKDVFNIPALPSARNPGKTICCKSQVFCRSDNVNLNLQIGIGIGRNAILAMIDRICWR